jgi:hypothetical protein
MKIWQKMLKKWDAFQGSNACDLKKQCSLIEIVRGKGF